MSSIILYHHFGLGDHIVCNGMVREYCKKYKKVAIFSLPKNYASVSFMYRDLSNIQILQGDEEFAKNFLLSNTFNSNNKYGYVKTIGFQYLNENSNLTFEKQFYKIAEIDFVKKWESFYVKRNFEKENIFYKKYAPSEKYIFYHDDIKRNYQIETKKISKKYKIFTPNENLTENIFDYCTIIENAEEIHVIDSSFMFLIDCLKYDNPLQKLYIHRYARENKKWKLPTLRKKWNVLILTTKQTERNGYISKLLDKFEILFLNHRIFKRITRKIYRTMGWRTRSQKRGSI